MLSRTDEDVYHNFQMVPYRPTPLSSSSFKLPSDWIIEEKYRGAGDRVDKVFLQCSAYWSLFSFVMRGFCCLAVLYYMWTAIFMNKWVNEDVSKVVDPTYWRYKGHYFLCLRFSFSFSITILDLCCSGEELLFAFILRKKIGLTFQSCLSFCAVLLWARNQKEVPVP